MDEKKVIEGAGQVLRLKRKKGPGILLLHGFTGNPLEMKYLGDKIFKAGYSISIPRYPGHGTSLQDMITTSPIDWFRTARNAYLELKKSCTSVNIVGLSMGGLFAILLSDEFEVDKIALLSVPRLINSWMVYAALVISPFIEILWIKDDKKGINWPEARKQHKCYDTGKPIKPAWMLYKLIKKTMKLLPRITSTVLIMQSRGDEVIPPDSANYICSHIGSNDKRIVMVEESNHAITVDYDRDRVASEVVDFLKK